MENTLISPSATALANLPDSQDVQATTSSSTVPDSSLQPYSAPFTEGEDILVHDQTDGLIYFGIVVEVDDEAGQCLVRFGDCTERWSSFFELRRLGDDSEPSPPATPPPLPPPPPLSEPLSQLEALHNEFRLDADTWVQEPEKVIVLPEHVIEARSQLSYEWERLEWDEAHQRNLQETYCYCGEKGDWFKKMLQCGDCMQWFHQECIRSLDFQLLSGDRFFKFTCTLCNGEQEESIVRLDIGMVDALHLVIFNLILSRNQKFHDLEASILPFLKKKLKYLAGNGNNANFKLNRIEPELISKILSNNKTRFMCGSEKGRQSNFWGLRKMMAPWLPSKYLLFRPRYASLPSNQKRLRETVIQPYNKSVNKRRQCQSSGKTAVRNHPKKGRVKDLSSNIGCGDHSDVSEASSFGTLDSLIKMPKDFSGRNNPFRLPGPPKGEGGGVVPSSGEVTPTLSTPSSSLKQFLSEKGTSPISSGTPSTATTEDSRAELLQSVEDMFSISMDEVVKMEEEPEFKSEEEPEFKTPGLVISDLTSSLSSYFAPNAKTRIARGEQFRVKARRLTLNGDIAYLIDWENSTPTSSTSSTELTETSIENNESSP